MKEFHGVISEVTDKRDWLGADIDLPRSPKGTDSFVKNGSIQYNQNDVHKNSCTLHGAMTAYSGLTGYEFSLDERKEIYQEALKRGFDNSIGWYIYSAVKLIAEWANKHCPVEVEYFRYNIGTPDFNKALRLGYMPVIGYRGNREYNADRDDNGIIDKEQVINSTYGHCLSGRYLKGSMYKGFSLTGAVDNYTTRKTNCYSIPTNYWKRLVKNGVFFTTAYIYVVKQK